MINEAIFVIIILVIAVLGVTKIKRLSHKIFAFFLIGIILFGYISFNLSLRNYEVDLKTIPGIMEAGKIYLSWLSGAFANIKSITAYASKQNWTNYNETDEISDNKTNEASGGIFKNSKEKKQKIEDAGRAEIENVTSKVNDIWKKLEEI